MSVTRIDLADRGSPEALVGLILKHEPGLKVPVPIEELCLQLDIEKIVPLDVEGFEGGLITDTAKSRGIILVRESAWQTRRRFTIGHELGHFLMPSHMPEEGRFLCSREDMMRLTAKESDRHEKIEVEANSAARLPPPRPVSIHNGAPGSGGPRRLAVSQGRVSARHAERNRIPSALYLDRCRARTPAPVVSEQVCLQAEGFALIMLWHEAAESEDEDEDRDEGRTSRERWKDRQARQ